MILSDVYIGYGLCDDIPDEMLDIVSSRAGLALVNRIRGIETRLQVLEREVTSLEQVELEHIRLENKELLMEIRRLKALLEIARKGGEDS